MKITDRHLKKIIREELMNEADTLLGQFQEDKQQLKMLADALRPPGGQVQVYAADFKESDPEFAAELVNWHRDFSILLDNLKDIVNRSL